MGWVGEVGRDEELTMANFKQPPTPPSQVLLIPLSLEEALPGDCEVRLLAEALALLDWRELEASYAATGWPAYPPRTLAQLLVYGYAKGLRASRKLEEALRHDLRFIWRAGGLRPDHTTLARFRRSSAAQLKRLFGGTVRLCAAAGLVLLETTATDGTRIPARGSKRALYNAKRLAREQAAVEALFAAAEAADAAEAGAPAGGVLPAELVDAQRRRAKLAEVAAQLKERGANSTCASEPDCRVMKTSAGLRPAYNVQLTVDAEAQVIVAAELTNEANDPGQLAGQLAQVAGRVQATPDLALADSGYCDERTLLWLRESGQRALLPPPEAPPDNNLFAARCFFPADGEDARICPASCHSGG